MIKRFLAGMFITAALVGGMSDIADARRGRGADDPAGHVRHGRGADDAPGDDHGGRRGRGSDDGPNHQ